MTDVPETPPPNEHPPVPLHHASFDKLRMSGDGPAGAERPLRVPRAGEELPRPTRATPRQATSVVAYTPAPEPEEDDPLLAFAPFVHPAPRRNSITPDKQRRFVAALAASGIVTQAARAIGVSMEALYKLRQRPGAEGFAAAWDEALRLGAERLEDCALERAMAGGWDHDGWTGRGDALLIYLLQRRGSFRIDERDLVPGHPVYDRLRGEFHAELRATEPAIDEVRAEVERRVKPVPCAGPECFPPSEKG